MSGSSHRIRLYGAVATSAVVLAAPFVGPSAMAMAASAPANLIRNPGAESANPNADGGKVAVRDWTTTTNDNFTAVAYGASGFPLATSPGPSHRGRNFFAGGTSGNSSTGSQVDALTAQRKLIRTGKARFTLSGWLGGYSSQGDHAVLRVTWENAAGAALGTARIGPVTVTQRNEVTGLLFRTTTGKVPKTAGTAVVQLLMVRDAGEYIDGYADNLSLTVYS